MNADGDVRGGGRGKGVALDTTCGAAATLGALMCTSGVVSTQQPASLASFSNAHNVDLPLPCQQTALAKWQTANKAVGRRAAVGMCKTWAHG